MTRLYSSGVLRYAENDSDIDSSLFVKYTAKGPNAIGNKSERRIPIRQRILHPSMVSVLDIAASSSSDPGRSGDLSPFNDMKSMYFDDSLYENEMHYKIAKYLDENPLDDDWEELRIVCDSNQEYNDVLNALYHAADGKFKMYGVSHNPMEIIVEKDIREGYRKFDESVLMDNNGEESSK